MEDKTPIEHCPPCSMLSIVELLPFYHKICRGKHQQQSKKRSIDYLYSIAGRLVQSPYTDKPSIKVKAPRVMGDKIRAEKGYSLLTSISSRPISPFFFLSFHGPIALVFCCCFCAPFFFFLLNHEAVLAYAARAKSSFSILPRKICRPRGRTEDLWTKTNPPLFLYFLHLPSYFPLLPI